MKNIFEEYNKALHYVDKLENNSNLKNYNKACCFEAFYMYKESLENINKAIECYNNGTIKLNGITKYMCFIKKGVILMRMEKYEEAMSIFEEAIEIEPNNPNGYINKIAALGILKKYEEAIKFCEENEKIIDKKDLYNLKGYLFQNKGNDYKKENKNEEAIECYEKAIKSYDTCIEHINKVMSNEKDNKNIIKYKDIIGNMNNNKANCIKSIKDINNDKDYSEVIECYNKAIKSSNRNYEALCFRGLISDNQKDLDEAIEVINNILNDNDNYESTYNIFSKLNLIKNKIEDSKYKYIINKLIKEDFSMKINYKIKNNSLYNYTSINKNTIKLIKNHGLWFSHTNNFNDPVDPSIKLFNRNSGEYDNLLDSIKVACLTTKNNNTLMWSHYADKHKGICIEYDISSILLDRNKNDFIIRKINYDRTAIINENIANINNIELYDLNLLIDLFSIKSKEWEYEDEYRILYYDREKRKDGLVVPLPIRSIYFGTETPEDDKELIRDIAENIELYELKFDDKELFKIILKE